MHRLNNTSYLLTSNKSAFSDTDGKKNKHAQAYYGLFKHLFGAELLSNALLGEGVDDDKLVKYAFEIDAVIKTAVAEYSINPAEIENAISMKLLPMLFADLGIEKTERFIQKVLQITRLGLSRG